MARTSTRQPKRNSDPFDAAYYARHYGDRTTRVHGPAEIDRLASGIFGFLGWWGVEVRRVLDVGAGTGLFRDWVKRRHPRVVVDSLEYSAYAAKTYGHEHADIATYRTTARYDLIFCQGVLPYLDDARCAAALRNLGHMAAGFLYLEAITRRDIAEVCDNELTDTSVFRRSGSFYRTHLAKSFVTVGAGLYYAKRGTLPFYELELGGPLRVAKKRAIG
jgi:2-polyprenyl-3-methyl-5-hydroxy-6-metoxy-1,4-benzoquinol methylase